MRSWTFLVLTTVFSISAFAQRPVSSGYIVRNNGDTVRGYLKEAGENALAERVEFRKGPQGDFTTYTVSEVASFRLDEGGLYKAIHFTNNSGGSDVPETRFGHVLAEGPYTLYGILENSEKFYVVKSDTATYFLYEGHISGTNSVPGNYLNQLNFFSASCEEVNREVSRISFTDKEMAAFMNRVNQCIDPGARTQNLYRKPKKVTHLVVYAGGLPDGDRFQVTAEAVVRIIYPSLNPKASINIGARYSNTGSVEMMPYASIEIPTAATHLVVSIPVTLQYNFLSGSVQPYVYVGFSGAYLRQSPPQLYVNIQKFGVGIIGGIGIEAYLTKGFAIKADWRYELLLQYPSIGVAYRF
jgi:hypothetical protein